MEYNSQKLSLNPYNASVYNALGAMYECYSNQAIERLKKQLILI